MLRLAFALLVAQCSALALQSVRARGAVVRDAAAVRSAAFMSDAAIGRDMVGTPIEVTPEIEEEAKRMGCDPQVLARLRTPIRQADGGWADTAGRYGGKKNTNVNGEIINATTHYGTGGGLRPEDKFGGSDAPELPPEKKALCVLPEESFKIEKMAMSQTDEDFVLECECGEEAEMFIDIEPMFLTKEEYFFGFTDDSSPLISIDHGMSSNIEGEMNAKEHNAARGTATLGSMERGEDTRRIMIKLKFQPKFEEGEFDAYLCFIFPNEKAFSKFYKITGKSTK